MVVNNVTQDICLFSVVKLSFRCRRYSMFNYYDYSIIWGYGYSGLKFTWCITINEHNYNIIVISYTLDLVV